MPDWRMMKVIGELDWVIGYIEGIKCSADDPVIDVAMDVVLNRLFAVIGELKDPPKQAVITRSGKVVEVE